MKKLMIGVLLLMVAIPGFAFNFFGFLTFLSGLIPVLAILGGAIAIYIGREEIRQRDDTDDRIGQARVERLQAQGEEQKPDTAPEPVVSIEEKCADTPSEAESRSEVSPLVPEGPCQMCEPIAPPAGQPAAAQPDTDTKLNGEMIQFKGNIETMVFHSVTCNFSSGKNCSMDFTTREAAEAQGYKPCKICMTEA